MNGEQTQSQPADVFVHPYKLSRDEANVFVGPKFDYYWSKWSSMSANGSKWSWNWAAFFLGPAWMGYRRMHFEALIALALFFAIYLLTTFLTSNQEPRLVDALLLIELGAMILFGALGNFLYLRKTAISARTVQEANHGDRATLARRGGTNNIAGGAWTFASILAALFLVGVSSQKDSAIQVAEQSPTYFTEERFRNPTLMQSVYSQQEVDTNLPVEARLVNAFYVKYAIDRIQAKCAWELGAIASIAKGALDFGEGVILTGHTIQSVQTAIEGQAQSAVISWFQGINDFDTLRQYANGDADRFLADIQTCESPYLRQMKDGFSWYLVSVAPQILSQSN